MAERVVQEEVGQCLGIVEMEDRQRRRHGKTARLVGGDRDHEGVVGVMGALAGFAGIVAVLVIGARYGFKIIERSSRGFLQPGDYPLSDEDLVSPYLPYKFVAMNFVFGNLDTQDDDEGRPAEHGPQNGAYEALHRLLLPGGDLEDRRRVRSA